MKNLQIYMIIITSNQLYDGKPYIIKKFIKKHAIDHYCTISSLTYNKIQLDIQILYEINNHIYIYPIQNITLPLYVSYFYKGVLEGQKEQEQDLKNYIQFDTTERLSSIINFKSFIFI